MALTKINNNTLSAITGLPAGVGGKVLQVVQSTNKTFSNYTANSSFRDISLSVTITPSSSSNKILIKGQVTVGMDNGLDQGYGIGLRILRDSTALNLPSVGGSQMTTFSVGTTGSNDDDCITAPFVYLDSPSSTSAITYKIQALGRDSKAFAINGPGDLNDDTNTNARIASTSSIIVMEVSAWL